jgi:peptidyl-prolyl cis-trans isomerase-like 1
MWTSTDDLVDQAPTPFLDGKHTIFGRVSSGMKTVQRLEAVRTDNNDRPVEDIKIHKARLGDATPLALQ